MWHLDEMEETYLTVFLRKGMSERASDILRVRNLSSQFIATERRGMRIKEIHKGITEYLERSSLVLEVQKVKAATSVVLYGGSGTKYRE